MRPGVTAAEWSMTMADDPFAELAVGLNEDAKASRKRKAKDADRQPETVETLPADEAPAENDADTHVPAEEEDTAESVIASRIGVIAEEAELDPRTLSGDLRDTMLDIFRTRSKPYSAMQEDEQRQVSMMLGQAAQDLVKKAVHVIRMQGDGSFYAKLDSYTEKGGIKISMTAQADLDTVIALHNASQKMVTIRVADPDVFIGQRGDPPIDPDQADLVFEGEPKAQAPSKEPYEGDNSDLADDAEQALAGDTDSPFGKVAPPAAERVNVDSGMVEISTDGENWVEDRPALEAELAAARDENPDFE